MTRVAVHHRRVRPRGQPRHAEVARGAVRQGPEHPRRDGGLTRRAGLLRRAAHSIGEHGTFDAKTRETLALAVAAVDRCSYCQAAHTAGGKAAGLTEQETIDARQGTSADPKLQALLDVVKQQMADAGNVADATFQTAVNAGWTEAQSPRARCTSRSTS